jgi:hypothetical protein
VDGRLPIPRTWTTPGFALFGVLQRIQSKDYTQFWTRRLGQRIFEKYPPESFPIDPSFFLFATPQKYYLYQFDNAGFYVAGDSMSEVYEGMKEAQFHGDGDWPPLENHHAIAQLNTDDYFPVHVWTHERGIILSQPVHDFEEEYAE